MNITDLHEFLKNQAASIDAKIEGKTLIDYINNNADEYLYLIYNIRSHISNLHQLKVGVN